MALSSASAAASVTGGGKIHGPGAGDGVGHHIANQGLQRGLADGSQHFLLLLGVRAYMTGMGAWLFSALPAKRRGREATSAWEGPILKYCD